MSTSSYLSDRINNLSESATLKMTKLGRELAAKGVNVISLSVGEPDFNTPEHVKDAAKKALDENWTRYSPVPGYPELRQAIVNKLKSENNLDYDIKLDHTYCSGCGVKAECLVDEKYESNFTQATAKLLNSLSALTTLVPFERSFDGNTETDDNLTAFQQLKETQEIVDLLNSIYGEDSTSIHNRHINFFDN